MIDSIHRNDQPVHVLPRLLGLPCWDTFLSRQERDFYLFAVTGFDLWLSVLTLGIVCNIYTALVSAARLRGGRRRGEIRRETGGKGTEG